MKHAILFRRIVTSTLLFAIVFSLCFAWYYATSIGLGDDNLRYDAVGLAAAAAAAVLPVILYRCTLRVVSLLPGIFIALSWIITGPYVSYATFAASGIIYLNNMYDIYIGLYLFGLTLCTYMLFRRFSNDKTAALVTSILQIIELMIPIIQWIYYALYSSCITTSGALIMYQTNISETGEYLHSLGIFHVVGIILMLLICLTTFFFVETKTLPIPKNNWGKLSVPIFALLIIIPSAYVMAESIVPESFPIRLFLDTHDYLQQSSLYATNHAEKYKALQVVQKNPAHSPNTVIVVIGESETRTLMNAYDPKHVQNTPWLTGEKSNPNFTLFTNVYSCAWYTVPVLEHALTESNFYNTKQFNQSTSIIDIAKKLGYKTYWFSNQGSIGIADTPITLVANTADVAKWTDKDNKESRYDESLLDFLKQVNPNENNFIVLHLMGSHIEYRNRYPKSFHKFDDGTLNEQADFDNTVLYTDWILSQIYQYAHDNLHLDAMVYFSDHGSDPMVRRQPDPTGFTVLRIPMFCYLSNQYEQRNPDVVRTLKHNQNAFFTNDLLYELVCGILNIKSPNYDESYSLASPKWKMKRKDLVTRFGETSLMDDTAF